MNTQTKFMESLNESGQSENTNNKDYFEKNTKIANENKCTVRIQSDDIEIYEIHDTPFSAVKSKNEWKGMTGKYMVGRGYTDLQETIDEMRKVDWNKITALIAIMIDEFKDQKATEI